MSLMELCHLVQQAWSAIIAMKINKEQTKGFTFPTASNYNVNEWYVALTLQIEGVSGIRRDTCVYILIYHFLKLLLLSTCQCQCCIRCCVCVSVLQLSTINGKVSGWYFNIFIICYAGVCNINHWFSHLTGKIWA